MRLAILLATLNLILATAPCQAPTSPASPDHRVMSALPDNRAADDGEDGGTPVPEPSTLLLVGSGLVGVALGARWRRRRTPAPS